ncbi:MAG: VanZ family protein [Sedimentisphaerales bacterium]|nr:VanZ family protein [Sedimentisphaerales bacterium]
MSLTRRHKVVIVALVLYWPVMFIATHIPTIPQWVGQIPLSDKTLHFFAYFFLCFLLWQAISPNRKVNWRKPSVWLILFVVVWYGIVDEWLQIYVGRHADVRDFFADLAGAVTALVILSFFHFWPASLVLGAMGILIFTNFYRIKGGYILFISSPIFFFCAYSVFTMIWLRYIHNFLPVRPPQGKWWFGALALPLVLLLALELFCIFAGHSLNGISTITSVVAVGIVVLTSFCYEMLTVKTGRNSGAV